MKSILRIIHPLAGALAMFTITLFIIATLASEVFGGATAIAAVKAGILRGLLVLIPALAIVGGSGFRLGTYGLAATKIVRMRVVAANGVLVLIPCAFVLARWAQQGAFDGAFYAVQGLELLAGSVNLTLLGLNMRDGLRMRAKRMAATSVRMA